MGFQLGTEKRGDVSLRAEMPPRHARPRRRRARRRRHRAQSHDKRERHEEAVGAVRSARANVTRFVKRCQLASDLYEIEEISDSLFRLSAIRSARRRVRRRRSRGCRVRRSVSGYASPGPRRDCRRVRAFARMAEEELVLKVQPDAVKKGSYCFVRGNPCKLDVCDAPENPRAGTSGCTSRARTFSRGSCTRTR